MNGALSLPADISETGFFQEGHVRIGDGAIESVDKDQVLQHIPLDSVRAIWAERLPGSGRLVVETMAGETIIAASYGLRHHEQYKAIVTHLEAVLAGGETLDLSKQLATSDDAAKWRQDSYRAAKMMWSASKEKKWLLLGIAAIFWALTILRLAVPQLERLIVDDVFFAPDGSMARFLLYLGVLSLVMGAAYYFERIRGKVLTIFTEQLSRDLRSRYYASVFSAPFKMIYRRRYGDLLNRIRYDTSTVQRFIQNQAAYGVNELFTTIGVAVLLFMQSWQLAVLVLLPIPFVLWYSLHIRVVIKPMFERQYQYHDRANAGLHEVLSGLRIVKAFGQERREVARFRKNSDEMARVVADNEAYCETVWPIMGFAMGFGYFVVLYYGGHMVLGHQMQLGELIQFSAYATMVYSPLIHLGRVPQQWERAVVAAKRLSEFVDLEPGGEVTGTAAIPATIPSTERATTTASTPSDPDECLRVERVTFSYEKDREILKDVNFSIQHGEFVGLVGYTGSGKSSLINLMCGLFQPDEGRITLGGLDIREIPSAELGTRIGVVPQETFLFDGSVYDNITYADPDASKTDVLEAAMLADAHDFIMRLPDGYDTVVGERGQRLSMGERQRISLARVLLRKPDVLLLDEATSAMDVHTEARVQEAITNLAGEKTIVAIAHRITTLRKADRIIVVENGRIAEVGSPAELMERRGIYYELVQKHEAGNEALAAG